jgi:plastocyanin
MFRTALIAAASMVAAASIAYAAASPVFQEDKKFSTDEVTISKGDTVTFTNKDEFTHNVYSTTPGMSFELKTQKPGDTSEVKFDRAGVAEVRCAIHPQMKMKVIVQ